tara:strand:+ start:136 stop:309 length:174 start_codon:yes stop_codon:yes gene_type:complete
MNIQIWYSSHASEWRWSLLDDSSRNLHQESGGQPELRDAMNDIANTIEHLAQRNLPE